MTAWSVRERERGMRGDCGLFSLFATRFSRFSFAKRFFYFHLFCASCLLFKENVGKLENGQRCQQKQQQRQRQRQRVVSTLCRHLTALPSHSPPRQYGHSPSPKPSWLRLKSEIHQSTSHPSDIMSNTRARLSVRAPDSQIDSKPTRTEQSLSFSQSQTRSSDLPPACRCLFDNQAQSVANELESLKEHPPKMVPARGGDCTERNRKWN